MEETQVVIEHPNRETSASKSTRAVVILLLVISALVMLAIMIGGWSELAGQTGILIAFILLDLVFAYYVGRWNRGVLPVAAALAMFVLIFAAVAAPGWFDRDATGFAETTIPAAVEGILCSLLIPIQVLLIAFAMRGFNQAWNVEVERQASPATRTA